MSRSKPILLHMMAVGLCAAIGFGALNIGQALTPKASAATAYETKVTYGVNLRASASTSGRIIRLIPTGESIHVISKVNSNWLKVTDQEGDTGYISASAKYTNYAGSSTTGTSSGTSTGSLSGTSSSSSTGTSSSSSSGTSSTSTSSNSKADQVISIAQSYMGRVTYDFGTRDPSKLIFDCSSFTQFVFAQVGVNLQWGTKYQQTEGSAVSKSSLQKGDLVFFDTIGSNDGVINHVGIYIGNGQFIHDTPSVNGLSINSLTSGYWSEHYVTARRVL